MLFSSSVFLFFFLPAVLLVYFLLPRKWLPVKNVFLLLASLLFYAWGEPKFVLVMLLSIGANYLFGLLVDKYRDKKPAARLVLVLMLVFNLSVIFINKYLMFFLTNLNALFSLQLAVPDIPLPIGISFFTFQSISYVLDIYRQKGEVQKNPLNVGLYISFFPQLIAGPIVRYQTVAEQIKYRRETWEDFTRGACRFIRGLSKKVLLSNTLAVVADAAFGFQDPSVTFAWLGAIAYTLQIFFDFSGYSDMAIGMGWMFGFHFDENFNYPYISKSVSEFWRRWHISLGTWFRDYVYFPLGGSRVKSKGRLAFNLFVVWFLTGVWHGANWTFILWGLYFFVLLAAEKLTGFGKFLERHKPVGLLYALLAALFGWVLFRAPDLSSALAYLGSMLGLSGAPFLSAQTALYLPENWLFFGAAILFCMPVGDWLKRKFPTLERIYGYVYPLCYMVLFLLSVAYIVKGTYNPFIYFNF